MLRNLRAYFILYAVKIKWIMCVQKKNELSSMSQRSTVRDQSGAQSKFHEISPLLERKLRRATAPCHPLSYTDVLIMESYGTPPLLSPLKEHNNLIFIAIWVRKQYWKEGFHVSETKESLCYDGISLGAWFIPFL